MSQTQRAHWGWASQARKISDGRVAPEATAARTSRSRIPLQLQTYTSGATPEATPRYLADANVLASHLQLG